MSFANNKSVPKKAGTGNSNKNTDAAERRNAALRLVLETQGKRLPLRALAKLQVAHKGLSHETEVAMSDRVAKVLQWREKIRASGKMDRDRAATYLETTGMEEESLFLGAAMRVLGTTQEKKLFAMRSVGPEADAKVVKAGLAVLDRAPAWAGELFFDECKGRKQFGPMAHVGQQCKDAKCFITTVKRMMQTWDGVESEGEDFDYDGQERYENAIERLSMVFFDTFDRSFEYINQIYRSIEELQRDHDLFDFVYRPKGPQSKKFGRYSRMPREQKRALEQNAKDMQAKWKADKAAGKPYVPISKAANEKLERLRAARPNALPHAIPKVQVMTAHTPLW